MTSLFIREDNEMLLFGGMTPKEAETAIPNIRNNYNMEAVLMENAPIFLSPQAQQHLNYLRTIDPESKVVGVNELHLLMEFKNTGIPWGNIIAWNGELVRQGPIKTCWNAFS